MPIDNYGIWVARPIRVSAERAETDPETPHIHLFYDDGTGGRFDNVRRASINVKSSSALSELVFWTIPDFRHPIVDRLGDLETGFRQVSSRPGTVALDYIRGNLIDLNAGRVLPHDRPGTHDDIIDFVMPELESAIQRHATVYLFGEPYSDMQGIHDIHMNQGSQGRFKRYNGVWQDGGIIVHYHQEDRYAAIFLAFASQSVHTDESSGHGLPGSRNLAQLLGPTEPDDGDEVTIADDRRVAIVAALVNPVGGENQPEAGGVPERVYLLNRSGRGVSLRGWSLLNKADHAHVLSTDIWLAPGEARSVTMGRIPLSNSGGLISLLDADGNKVDGVSYTREQASSEGELIVFR
jgi:uncharacterized protein YukJ